MVEIIAIVRSNKTGAVKKALLDAGSPEFTCQKCRGRGKMPIDIVTSDDPSVKTNLVSKRIFNIFCEDNIQDTLVESIIKAAHTGKPGDGKIFVCPVETAYSVREGTRS